MAYCINSIYIVNNFIATNLAEIENLLSLGDRRKDKPYWNPYRIIKYFFMLSRPFWVHFLII